jgi:hypothetical protein
LGEIVSGSFDKIAFRDILSASPVSASLIPLFDSSSYTSNSNFPDYVVKNSLQDNSLTFSNKIGFYNFVSTGSYSLGLPSGSDFVEKFIIGIGVIDIFSEEVPSYWLANNSIKYTHNSHHFVKKDDTWSFNLYIEVGNSLLDKDGNEVEITSISEVLESETFYSLNVEDIDTYFQSDILVHNLPPK